jgi:hypothetical protein
MRFIVKGELPSLNEYIAANNRNRFIANKMKRDATELVVWQVKNIEKITTPANYYFHWVVKNKKKDPDNVAYACKFVFDGLQEAGKLENDSMAWVKSIHHTYSIGEPSVEITVDNNIT